MEKIVAVALKPTIFKIKVALSDLNRNYYDSLSLTIAQHPSETTERMLVRFIAFCLNADEGLAFTKGLSATEEADLCLKNLDDSVELWIEVGEPAADRIKKVGRLAKTVKVYCFNTKSDTWWDQNKEKLFASNLEVVQLPWTQIQKFSSLLERTMDLSFTITGNSAYVAAEKGECEISWKNLK